MSSNANEKNNFNSNIRATDDGKNLHSEPANNSKKEHQLTQPLVPPISKKNLEEQNLLKDFASENQNLSYPK